MDGDSEDDEPSMGSAHPIFDQDQDHDASWPSICSHHGSRYPSQERIIARNKQGAIVMGYTKRTLNAQDLPWVIAWLQGEPEGMIVGVSLCLLTGDIFPIDGNRQFSQGLEAIGRVLLMSKPC